MAQDPTDDTGAAFSQAQLGRLLRDARQRLRYSIHDVAESIGISSSFLSLVETGKSDIAFGRLMRLTEFYGVTLGDLFPSGNTADIVVARRKDARTVPAFAEGIKMVLLAAGEKSALTTFVAEYQEGVSMSEPTLHEGEAFVYVISGKIGIEVDTTKETVVLGPGDSAHLNTSARRTYKNVGRSTATLLGVLLRADDVN
jgi:transcriptional regulator with XRE-family HTH domain